MWTNIYRLGGLQNITWFQLLSSESDSSSLVDKSQKPEQRDGATFSVLSSHLLLQNEGFLSTWTNSFIGPWDPSQGTHNPDAKIKLWLFIPGRHMTMTESAQPLVSKLRVVKTGLWMAPGDSEEVGVALAQALRNRLERSLRVLSYVRFGDVFSKCHFSTLMDRRNFPTCEFIFAANEEAIFVHVVISGKCIRMLSGDDMERVLGCSSSDELENRLPVIVSPHGMRGWLTGCCPGDLVKQVYSSKSRYMSTTAANSPVPHTAHNSGCKLRGQNCFAEITLGVRDIGSEESSNSQVNFTRTAGISGQASSFEKTFIYPSEALVVPVLHTSLARSSLKRFWFKGSVGTSLLETGPLLDLCSHMVSTPCSSRSSNGSSTSSSLSSTSGDSENRKQMQEGELEADADSLSCRQSGLSSNSQLEGVGQTMTSKRSRTDTGDSFGQIEPAKIARRNYTGMGFSGAEDASLQDCFKPYHSPAESVTASAVVSATNDQLDALWGWVDDDARGLVMDIQVLMSEFGDFNDLFQDEYLSFSQPQGAIESDAFMLTAANHTDNTVSPAASGLEVSDQLLLPAIDFSSLESISQLPTEGDIRHQEASKDATSTYYSNSTVSVDQFSKSEAKVLFVSEYAAVQISESVDSFSIFKNPYLPKSKKVEASLSACPVYTYGAMPPLNDADGTSSKYKETGLTHDSAAAGVTKHYIHLKASKSQTCTHSSTVVQPKEETPPASRLAYGSPNTPLLHLKTNGGKISTPDNFFLSLRTTLATDIESLIFQTSMCRARHVILSRGNLDPSAGTLLGEAPGDISLKASSHYEPNKNDSLLVSETVHIDMGAFDGLANLGVWRPVGIHQGNKPMTTSNFDGAIVSQRANGERASISEDARVPMQTLLDAIGFLVQQSTSFVDLSLDGDCGDGPYGLLAFLEQQRRGFTCGPSLVHAGCGGLLASCHSLDVAGVELPDPLSADVYPSSVISLLQSDFKFALKSAFKDKTVDGPLSVTDWCKSCSLPTDSGPVGDVYSADSSANEIKDSSFVANMSICEPISPSQSSTSGTATYLKDDSSQRRSNQDATGSESDQQGNHGRSRPSIIMLPTPTILTGYQDDWLKISHVAIQGWEKGPLQPYARPKPVSYFVVCPGIDVLTSAAADFFQQLGTVYEACKLGTHSPHIVGSEMGLPAGRWSPSGFVLIDCPQAVARTGSNHSVLSSVNDYVSFLSKNWNSVSYCKSLSKTLKALRLGSTSTSPKEGIAGPCTVIYVVCPFPSSDAVLQTLVESSAAIGSNVQTSDANRRLSLSAEVEKALSLQPVDDASMSKIITLSGFSISRIVLQVITIEALLKVNRPPLSENITLKEIAFTVYNKTRRISRTLRSHEGVHSSLISSRAQLSAINMSSAVPGVWKQSGVPRGTGSPFPRESNLDGSLRSGPWDNSWQMLRSLESNYDVSGPGELVHHEEPNHPFEPLFILASPGSSDSGLSSAATPESTKISADDTGGYSQLSGSGGNADTGSFIDGMDPEFASSSNPRSSTLQSLHCTYGWTEDWRWLACIWTDSRGELLDSHIFPFGGISARQDTKGLQDLFIQVLQLGCRLLSTSDATVSKPRDMVISRIGCFYELECQEWQRAIFSVGGGEVKKWPLQLRRNASDGVNSQQQELALIQDRGMPSSPNPSSIYASHVKSPGYIKGSLPVSSARKQLLPGQTSAETSRGAFHSVQSISLVGVSLDHSLQLVLPAESHGAGVTGGATASGSGTWSYLESFTPVKSLGSTSSAYVLIPSPGVRFLPPMPMQLPTTLTSKSPPLAHLLHSKGLAVPLSTGFVVSRAVPSVRNDSMRNQTKGEWPSTLSVSLVDYFGGYPTGNDRSSNRVNVPKQNKGGISGEMRESELDTRLIVEFLAAELHGLSWLTVSPAYVDRRTALPFHCDVLLRLNRLLHYADNQLLQGGNENLRQSD